MTYLTMIESLHKTDVGRMALDAHCAEVAIEDYVRHPHDYDWTQEQFVLRLEIRDEGYAAFDRALFPAAALCDLFDELLPEHPYCLDCGYVDPRDYTIAWNGICCGCLSEVQDAMRGDHCGDIDECGCPSCEAFMAEHYEQDPDFTYAAMEERLGSPINDDDLPF